MSDRAFAIHAIFYPVIPQLSLMIMFYFIRTIKSFCFKDDYTSKVMRRRKSENQDFPCVSIDCRVMWNGNEIISQSSNFNLVVFRWKSNYVVLRFVCYVLYTSVVLPWLPRSKGNHSSCMRPIWTKPQYNKYKKKQSTYKTNTV